MLSYQQHMLQVLENGTLSDITIRIFDKEYKLHRLNLQLSPFFQRLMNHDLDYTTFYSLPSNNEVDYHLDDGHNHEVSPPLLKSQRPKGKAWSSDENTYEIDIDSPLIDKESFELIIRRLYGCHDESRENSHRVTLLFTAHYFEYQYLVTEILERLLRTMTVEEGGIILAHQGEGPLTTDLVNSAKAHLSNLGYNDGPEAWDNVPDSTIESIICGGGFATPSFYDKVIFILQIMKRRTSDPMDHSLLFISLSSQLESVYQALTEDKKSELQKYRCADGTWSPTPNFASRVKRILTSQILLRVTYGSLIFLSVCGGITLAYSSIYGLSILYVKFMPVWLVGFAVIGTIVALPISISFCIS